MIKLFTDKLIHIIRTRWWVTNGQYIRTLCVVLFTQMYYVYDMLLNEALSQVSKMMSTLLMQLVMHQRKICRLSVVIMISCGVMESLDLSLFSVSILQFCPPVQISARLVWIQH